MSLRVGVVGLGLGHMHAQAYDRMEAVGAVILCDPDREKAKSIERSLAKAEGIYASIDKMLTAEVLDAVSIVTPDHLHRSHAEAAFSAGCHVLITKPLATNLEDARSIIRSSKSTGRMLMVAQEHRFHSREQQIKAIINSGDLGEIIHLRIDSFHHKQLQFQQSPWYASLQAGRTAMVGTAIHEVDPVRYLTGKRIESVFAYGNRLGDLDFHGNKTVAALFQLEGGTIAQVTVTYVAAPRTHILPFVLLGTKGMITGNRVVRHGYDHDEELPTDDHPIATGTYECVTRFVKSITHEDPIAVEAEDAFASLAACIAADRSCTMGVPVVPDVYAHE